MKACQFPAPSLSGTQYPAPSVPAQTPAPTVPVTQVVQPAQQDQLNLGPLVGNISQVLVLALVFSLMTSLMKEFTGRA